MISPSLIGSGEECSKKNMAEFYCFLCRHVVYGIECQRIRSSLSVFFSQFRDRIKQVKILEIVFLISNFDQVQESLTFFFISQEQLIISAIFMVTNTCK